MSLIKRISRKHLASDSLAAQIWGALLKQWWLIMVMAVMILIPVLMPESYHGLAGLLHESWYLILLLTLFVLLISAVCITLTNIFNLRKKEEGITWCQIAILFAIGLWIFGFLAIANIQQDSRYYVAFGILGSMLAFVFQDTLKGVMAFIHLRLHHLLCIDDWIKVPKYNVDGVVTRVTLTTVTVYNWDTTSSSIPTSALHSDSFVNLQKMSDGKTYGREMSKKFIFDTAWFHPLTAEEVARLKEFRKTTVSLQYLPEDEIKEGVLNAKVYREFVFHWMMNHAHLSQHPYLLVRWLEQENTGMPLQIYAFMTDTAISPFESQQSQIIEHVVESVEWFGLKLYQCPSGYDVERRTNA